MRTMGMAASERLTIMPAGKMSIKLKVLNVLIEKRRSESASDVKSLCVVLKKSREDLLKKSLMRILAC